VVGAGSIRVHPSDVDGSIRVHTVPGCGLICAHIIGLPISPVANTPVTDTIAPADTTTVPALMDATTLVGWTTALAVTLTEPTPPEASNPTAGTSALPIAVAAPTLTAALTPVTDTSGSCGSSNGAYLVSPRDTRRKYKRCACYGYIIYGTRC
jgi:hypothetical protein